MTRSRVAITGVLLFFLALVLLPMLFAVSSVWAIDSSGEPITIGAGETIEEDSYLFGSTITIDGTLKGKAVARGEAIALNGIVEDDVYLAAETVTIDGTVKGDAVVAGRLVTVNGTVEGDVVAAAQAVVINGTVTDDLRMAGERLVLEERARVADDAVAAGFSLESKAGSQVASNLYFSGGQALLAGTVDRHMLGGMGAMELRGTVGGNVRVAVGDSKPWRAPFTPESSVKIPEIPVGLTVADSAQIGGQLTYLSNGDPQISEAAQVTGGVVAMPSLEVAEPEPTLADVVLKQVRRLVTLVLVGCLLMWSIPGWTQSLAATVQAKPLPSLGWGVVSFLVVGAVSIVIVLVTALLTSIFAVTLQGLVLPVLGLGILAYLGLMVGFFIFIAYIPQIAVSFLGGRWLLQKIQPNLASGRYIPLIVGLVGLAILTGIPIAGGILSFIIILLGLGSLWIWGRLFRGDRFSREALAMS